MANEKSRNHDTGGGKGGTSKHQGKPADQDQPGDATGKDKQGADKAVKPGADNVTDGPGKAL